MRRLRAPPARQLGRPCDIPDRMSPRVVFALTLLLATGALAEPPSAKALERYRQMLAANPAEGPALGRAWIAAGDTDRASAAWERTVALDPANTELRRRLAETYRQNRLPERALTHLEYIAAHAPASERAAAYQEISRQDQALRRPEEAIRALEQAVALTSPGNWLWSDLQGQLIRLYQ